MSPKEVGRVEHDGGGSGRVAQAAVQRRVAARQVRSQHLLAALLRAQHAAQRA